MASEEDRTDAPSGQDEDVAAEAAVAVAERRDPSAPSPIRPDDQEIARILKIRVPVIAQLASRPMPVAEIRRFATGVIIEFEKSLEEDLNLLINNRQIGRGNCVKVGENFGLRVTRIANARRRIESMGA